MMERLIQRGQAIASAAERRWTATAATRLRVLFGSAAVTIDGDRIIVRGRGLLARWLSEPLLRFFGRGRQ